MRRWARPAQKKYAGIVSWGDIEVDLVPEDHRQLGEREWRAASRSQSALSDLGVERLEAPVACRVELERFADDRCAVRVDFEDGFTAAAAVSADIEVADRRDRRPDAVAGFLLHAKDWVCVMPRRSIEQAQC